MKEYYKLVDLDGKTIGKMSLESSNNDAIIKATQAEDTDIVKISKEEYYAIQHWIGEIIDDKIL